MSIRSVTCGHTELVRPAIPNDDPFFNVPEARIQAGPGRSFCKVEATLRATGTQPTYGDDFGNLVSPVGIEYAQDEIGRDASITLNTKGPSAGCGGLCIPMLNPGEHADFVKIYHVPAGTQAASIAWPDFPPEVRFSAS
jgi:hypothetical protein